MIVQTQMPVVFAKFVHQEILGEWGRLLFSLLDAFVKAGYEIKLFDNMTPKDLGKYGPLALSLPNLSLTRTVPADTSELIYLFDAEDKTLGKRAWRKKVEVRFDAFSPYWFSEPIIMPYPVHPVHAGADLQNRLQACRTIPKKMRIFFSGETDGYITNRIHYPNKKLLRTEAIAIITKQMGDKLSPVKDEAGLGHLLATRPHTNTFVLGATNEFRIDTREWLSTLAKAEFFLCLPGFIMPMCHNAAEAMAVGAIPIINYAEWFDPSLEHLKNCIVFDDGNDLIAKLNMVLEMPGDQVEKMRRNVVDYYDNWMTPSSFCRRIEAMEQPRVVVLLITDANVIKQATRLNRHSVLIRGTSMVRAEGFLGHARRAAQRMMGMA